MQTVPPPSTRRSVFGTHVYRPPEPAPQSPLPPQTRLAPAPPRAAMLRRAVSEPGRAVKVGIALLKGHFYRWYYPVRGIRFRAGRNLRVFGRLDIRGPGEVIFGDNVIVHDCPTPWTETHEARIVIGDNVIIGATRFGCAKEIIVGRDCLLARASVMDTDFHSTRADRRDSRAPIRVAPVHIGDNVWISQDAGILPGTRIGRNSVVSFGAVCMREFPENVIIAGNPARVAAPIPASATFTITEVDGISMPVERKGGDA